MRNWIACGLAATLTAAGAQNLPTDEQQRACWLRYTAERTRVNLREPTAVEFGNLKSHVAVRSPFVVDFAVRGMGVVPAGKAQKGTGHHHILVDQPLPPSVTDKIPFSDRHRHFGKGQTSAVLDLPPGEHRLRLLFADHDHRPYFVFSPEIVVRVTGPRSSSGLPIDPARLDATCEAWYRDELARPRPAGDAVWFGNLRSGETVGSPFTVRLGVDGYGVCAAGQQAERCGHFVLEVVQGGRTVRVVDLSSGATQTNLSLDNGGYTLRLRLVEGGTQRELLAPAEATVTVSGQLRI